MLTKPFTELSSYIAFFRNVEFPVLRKTARQLAQLRENEDELSPRQVGAVIHDDPLMALKLLIYQLRRRGRNQNHDITTVERAVMMIGMTQFFEYFGDLPTIEDTLAEHPKALIGCLKVIARAKRAMYYARDWAILRHDIDVEEITVATLLNEVAEILCWCCAPDLTEKAFALQRATPGLRSAAAQRAMMGVSIAEIQLGLAREFELPQLLITLMDPANAENPRVRTVTLACDLARHAANGWNDPALPDDFKAIGELLHLDHDALMNRLKVPEDARPAQATPDGAPEQA
ncbi:HDOD domain-containing protein [Niveibacterium terrae]|uniref:HDOD domain-containing protein n=1 Tax=Niveibacterium terrae TaxID=3373598 RepID=UPI003A93CD2E